MAPAFSKEAILQGSVDHLCLVCESYLRSDRETSLHVATAAHARNLHNTDYVDKYRQDRIRKVKKWYFCEFCNVLASTMTAVGLHVQETRHKENRLTDYISRDGDVILCGNMSIREEAWHGFIENTCAVCNVEYEDEVVHKSEPSHVINLVQSKVVHEDDNVYRKIDDFTFQCLTCNEILAEITTHFDNTKHKLLRQGAIVMSSKKENDIVGSNKTPAEGILGTTDYITCDGETSYCILCKCDVNPLEVQIHTDSVGHQKLIKVHDNLKHDAQNANHNSENASEILDSIQEFQKNNVNVNFESCMAVCKRCSVNLEFNCKEIEKHIQEHKNEHTDVKGKATGSKPFIFGKDEKDKTRDTGSLFTSPVFRTSNGENKLKMEPKSTIKQNGETDSTEITKENGNKDTQKLAEEHGLTYISIDNKVFCQRCNKYTPPSLRKILKHVKSKLHIMNEKISSVSTNTTANEITKKISVKKCNLASLPMNIFIREIQQVSNLGTDDIIFNGTFCIDVFSFTYLRMTSPGILRCQVCQVNLRHQDLKDHLNLIRHERATEEMPVLLHPDKEFIRKIRSDLYQCGYCNIYESWEQMENHLKSTEHKESKTFANLRLSQHLPQIERRRMERNIQNAFLMHLLTL